MKTLLTLAALLTIASPLEAREWRFRDMAAPFGYTTTCNEYGCTTTPRTFSNSAQVVHVPAELQGKDDGAPWGKRCRSSCIDLRGEQ